MKWRLEHKSNYYKVLVKWWDEHNYPKILIKALPNNIYVAFSEESGEDICAIPVYLSDANFIYISFLTMNPSARLREKATVIPFLLDAIERSVGLNGYERVFATSNVTGIMKNLEKAGYTFLHETNYYIKDT